jgi:hypothetical protein
MTDVVVSSVTVNGIGEEFLWLGGWWRVISKRDDDRFNAIGITESGELRGVSPVIVSRSNAEGVKNMSLAILDEASEYATDELLKVRDEGMHK